MVQNERRNVRRNQRCAMALGVGLHLWSQINGQDECFLDKQLEKQLGMEDDKPSE